MPGTYSPNALQVNLQRLLIIRMIVFVCQVVALLYARFVLALPLDYALILGIFAILALFNGALYLRLKQEAVPNLREFFVHLLIDVAGLSLLLYFTGGASNPFISYLLVPVTIAAATLTPFYTWLLAGLALACHTLLLFFYQPLPELMPAEMDMAMHGMDHGASATTTNLHIVGMWFNFLVSAALITYFVVKMAAEIRTQEERLSRYREDTLRNEQILAVATQAAGTAHEMGTPLGTMAVLLKDMQNEYRHTPELAHDLGILQQQVQSCREALRSLVQKADFKNQRTQVVALKEFIHALFDQWQLLRPELPCSLTVQEGSAPDVQVELTLQQALINMLNNAADASPAGITVTLHWNAEQWTLQIRDHGKGVSRELAEQLGTRIISTKEGGLGVGLVLSQATINRLGGKVSLYPLDDGGTLTEIILPHRNQVAADG